MKKLSWLYTFEVLFALFVVVNCLDYYSTKLLVDLGGPSVEVNPIMRWAIILMGTFGMIVMKSAVLGIMWWFREHIRLRVLVILNIIFVGVVVNNFINYHYTLDFINKI